MYDVTISVGTALAQELTSDKHFAQALKNLGWKHISDQNPMLIRKIRHKNNRTHGYVVAFVKNDILFLGYSLWDGKKWNGVAFDPDLCRTLAIKRAVPITKLDLNEIPWSAREEVTKIVGQSIKYFKQLDLPSLFGEEAEQRNLMNY